MAKTWEESDTFKGVRMIGALCTLQGELADKGDNRSAEVLEEYIVSAPFESFCRLADILARA